MKIKSQQVLFGAGLRFSLEEKLSLADRMKALIVSTSGQHQNVSDISISIGARFVGAYSNATLHTPIHVTLDAIKVAENLKADCIISVGGGAAVGLGKALAYRTGLMHIAVPTTYAGSECTPILGETIDNLKSTKTHKEILPDIVIYDPELLVTLPIDISVTSGINAIAHAVEALYARNRTESSTKLAMTGIKHLVDALPNVVINPRSLKFREQTLRGAWACGKVLGQVGMALHHKLCHTIGGLLNLPHSKTHAIILPHAVAYNEPFVGNCLVPIAELLDHSHASRGLWEFANSLGAPNSLKTMGVTEFDLIKISEIVLDNPYWNPARLRQVPLRQLLYNALEGSPPSAIQGDSYG